MPQKPKPPRQILHFSSQALWQGWLQQNAGISEPVWLKISKQQTDYPSVSYVEALDVALCFGWIDSQKDKLDETFWLQRFSRRTPKGPWSQINCDKVEKLIADGKMTALGLAEVNNAKADGRWQNAYAAARNMEIPADFIAMLEPLPDAKAFFLSLNKANLFAIYYRLQSAKKPETRQKRLQIIVDMMKERKKFHS